MVTKASRSSTALRLTLATRMAIGTNSLVAKATTDRVLCNPNLPEFPERHSLVIELLTQCISYDGSPNSKHGRRALFRMWGVDPPWYGCVPWRGPTKEVSLHLLQRLPAKEL